MGVMKNFHLNGYFMDILMGLRYLSSRYQLKIYLQYQITRGLFIKINKNQALY